MLLEDHCSYACSNKLLETINFNATTHHCQWCVVLKATAYGNKIEIFLAGLANKSFQVK